MAEDARGRDRAVLDFFDVGGADAADGDLDEEFMGAEARDGHGFEAQVVHAAINDGAHGFGNGEPREHLTTDGHGWTRIFLSRLTLQPKGARTWNLTQRRRVAKGRRGKFLNQSRLTSAATRIEV